MADALEKLVVKLVKKCQENDIRPEKCFLDGDVTCKYRSEKKHNSYMGKNGNPRFGYYYDCNK